jgi:hypothetical protein
MTVFFISFLIIVFAALGMAIGTIARRRPIVAGCARFGGLDDRHAECDICGSPCQADQSTG